ncbi:hypothetical protein BH09MYX1_BH09MYX1_02150 [soil metagenome]
MIIGAISTDLARLRSEIAIADGSIYNETKLEQGRARLRALGPHRDVALSTKEAPSATRWTVTYEIHDR